MGESGDFASGNAVDALIFFSCKSCFSVGGDCRASKMYSTFLIYIYRFLSSNIIHLHKCVNVFFL